VAVNKSNNPGTNGTTNTNGKPKVHRCTHCKRFHPKIPEDKCWNLEKNTASHPAKGMSSKQAGTATMNEVAWGKRKLNLGNQEQ